MYIRVTYALISINSNCPFFFCNIRTVNMYVLQTNEVNQSFVRNVSIFESQQPTAALTDTTRDGSTLLTRQTRTVRISADLSTSGFYVAFRDVGACVRIYEVVVYYPICNSISLELGANFSMNQLPGDSVGLCFTNMAINLNTPNDPLTATCTVSGLSQNELFTSWTISNGSSRCMCLPGYRFTTLTTIEQCEGIASISYVVS